MTRDEIKERVPILNAWLEQKPISFRWKNKQTEHWLWTTFTIAHGDHPDIFNEYLEWMVIPKPPHKPREWWLEIDSTGMCYRVSQLLDLSPACHNHSMVHVREVLSSEPDLDSIDALRYASKHILTKDPAEPPDQQPRCDL